MRWLLAYGEAHALIRRRIPRWRHGSGQSDKGQSRRFGSLNRLPHKRTTEALPLIFERDIDFGNIESILELSRRQESYRSATAVIRDPKQARVQAWPPRGRWRRVHLVTKTMFDKSLPADSSMEGNAARSSSRAGRIGCAVDWLIAVR